MRAFFIFWLAFLGLAAVPWTRDMLRSYERAPTLFLAAWIAAWGIVVGSVVVTLAWQLTGREIVSVSGATLAIRREALGVGWTRAYDQAHVQNVRVAPAPRDPFEFGSVLRLWGTGAGLVAFDYGARTHRFGDGIEEAEAGEIAEEIRRRLPFGT